MIALTVTISALGASASAQEAPENARKDTELLYVLSDPTLPEAPTLARCDAATLKRYRAANVQVVAVGRDKWQQWLGEGGKAYAGATEPLQLLAFARAHGAGAIGGLTVSDISPAEAKSLGLRPGRSVHSFGLSRTACTMNDVVEVFPADHTGEVPLHIGGKDHAPFAVPAHIDPLACAAKSGAPSAQLTLLGNPLPNLIARDLGGAAVSLHSLRGSVIVLDFWGTWCTGCILEMPVQQMVSEKFADRGVRWLAVSADENESAWKRFVKRNALPGIQVRAPHWAKELQIDSFPTVMLIDRHSVVRCFARRNDLPCVVASLLND